MNVVEFKVPKKPRVIEKEEVPYQKRYSVMPFAALTDARLHHLSIRVLALICGYTNRAGITWVGQARIAGHLDITKQAVNKAVKELKTAGYIEVIKRGFRGEKADTIRIVFDKNISAEEAISITSSQEDTRSPDMAKRDREIMAIMADNDREDITPEELERNRKRLNALVGTLVNTGSFRYHQPQKLGGNTMPRKPTRKKELVNLQVDECNQKKEELHSQPIVNRKVDSRDKKVTIEEVLKRYESVNTCAVISDTDARWASLLVEAGVTEADLNEALLAKRGASLTAVCQVLLARLGV